MAHESFEDDATATLMNEEFVCIKVDREERPDLDAVYMNATVAMTGQGGWPMTCFLTPQAEPFYCGTYYPRVGRGGMPSFTQVLSAVADAWRTRRDEVLPAASAAVDALRQQASGLPDADVVISPQLLDHAVDVVRRDEDMVHGGFGGAPKFPPSALMEGLLRGYERTGDRTALDSVARVGDAMARGGIYDQVNGGFSRYSVDAGWVVPHFEKMLYDNALLLRAYGHLARLTDASVARRVAVETAQFLCDDLADGFGGFVSALDADTDGVEGATYVWTPEQLQDVLGPIDGAWAAAIFGVTEAGTFEHGASVLRLPTDPDDAARFDRMRAALRASRSARPQPARDAKVVTAWNGMAIVALAEAGAALDCPTWVDTAAACARYLLATHIVDGRLRRTSLGGVAGAADGVLEDHAWLVTGLLALHQATADPEWLAAAQRLLDTTIDRFADPDAPGSWYDTAADAEALIARPRDAFDGATPAGASAVAEALLTAAASSEPESAARYGESAASTLDRAALVLARAPRSAGHWLAVAEASLRGPMQVAVVGDHDDPGFVELARTARRSAPGGAVVIAGAPNAVPLLSDRPLVAGRAAAYVCRGSVCDLPVTTPADLSAALAGRR